MLWLFFVFLSVRLRLPENCCSDLLCCNSISKFLLYPTRSHISNNKNLRLIIIMLQNLYQKKRGESKGVLWLIRRMENRPCYLENSVQTEDIFYDYKILKIIVLIQEVLILISSLLFFEFSVSKEESTRDQRSFFLYANLILVIFSILSNTAVGKMKLLYFKSKQYLKHYITIKETTICRDTLYYSLFLLLSPLPFFETEFFYF